MRAFSSPRKTQKKILDSFLCRNADTSYGRRYGYAEINSVEMYQDRVPVVTYDEIEPWIERMKAGERHVLTSEEVRFFETTSGSTSDTKFIPYTDSLLTEFRKAISTWLFDLFISHPGLMPGSHYWSISPAGVKHEPTTGGIPVGLENDSAYLGMLGKIALNGVMAVPLELSQLSDIEEWRRQTLRHLIARRDLRFISVWNPSFLILLLDDLPEGFEAKDYWPDLQLISCWTSASAARSLHALKARFPDVEIQGKGLLATEGVVSIPMHSQLAPGLAIDSHFLEFIDDQGVAHLADELDVGRRYRVLMTTGSGFARYDLGDMVEVVAPMSVEFVGRSSVSDLRGEKLSESFVGNVLENATITESFSMLVPEWSEPPRYLLITDSDEYKTAESRVEKGLAESVHYRYCRSLGQLGSVEAVYVPDAMERYQHACMAMGQRAGDIKPAALRLDMGWRERMLGHADA